MVFVYCVSDKKTLTIPDETYPRLESMTSDRLFSETIDGLLYSNVSAAMETHRTGVRVDREDELAKRGAAVTRVQRLAGRPDWTSLQIRSGRFLETRYSATTATARTVAATG